MTKQIFCYSSDKELCEEIVQDIINQSPNFEGFVLSVGAINLLLEHCPTRLVHILAVTRIGVKKDKEGISFSSVSRDEDIKLSKKIDINKIFIKDGTTIE